MKFIVTREDGYNKPCDNAEKVLATYLDWRIVPTLAMAQEQHWFLSWFNGGVNHREDKEKRMVVCERKKPHKVWVIDIPDLDALLTLQKHYGCAAICKSSYKEYPLEIELGIG